MPLCTSWQQQLEPSCHCRKDSSSGSTASPWRSVQGQTDFRSFLKDIQPDFEEEVSFLFPVVLAPHRAPSVACFCAGFTCSLLSAWHYTESRHRIFHVVVSPCPSVPPGVLGFSSQATAAITLFSFLLFSIHSPVLGCYLRAE